MDRDYGRSPYASETSPTALDQEAVRLLGLLDGALTTRRPCRSCGEPTIVVRLVNIVYNHCAVCDRR